MKLRSQTFKLMAISASLWACSSSSANIGLENTALSRAPRATEAVSTSGSSIVSRSFAAATTGLGIATAAESDFGIRYTNYVSESDVSTEAGKKVKHYGPCEALNFTRGALGMAAEADSMLNILSAVIPADQVATYANGQDHIIQIGADLGEDSETSKMKMNVTPTGDQVSAATFHVYRQSGESFVQEQSISQTISNGALTMTRKGTSQPENPEVDEVTYQVSVTGTVNSSNEFTGEKTINMHYQNDFADSSSTPFQSCGSNHHADSQ